MILKYRFDFLRNHGETAYSEAAMPQVVQLDTVSGTTLERDVGNPSRR